MKVITTPQYILTFSNNYVIAEAMEGAVVNNISVAENLKVVFDHFNGKPFVLISNRKHNYSVDIDVYTLKLMKKIKAFAIVSTDAMIKERAMVEQLAFDQSFAFFSDLEEAKGWAESIYY